MIIELKTALVRTGKNQMQVAREIEVNPSILSKIFNGWVFPKESVAIKLAKVLGMSLPRFYKACKENIQGIRLS